MIGRTVQTARCRADPDSVLAICRSNWVDRYEGRLAQLDRSVVDASKKARRNKRVKTARIPTDSAFFSRIRDVQSFLQKRSGLGCRLPRTRLSREFPDIGNF